MRCWTRPDLTWRCWKGCCWGCPSCRRRLSSLRRRPVLLVLAICLSSCVPRSLLANWLTGYLDHVPCWLFCSLPGDGVLAALAWPGFADVGFPGRDGHQDLAVRGDLEAAQAGGRERRGRGIPRRRAARCSGSEIVLSYDASDAFLDDAAREMVKNEARLVAAAGEPYTTR